MFEKDVQNIQKLSFQQHIQGRSSELGDVHILPLPHPNMIASGPLATYVYY